MSQEVEQQFIMSVFCSFEMNTTVLLGKKLKPLLLK
jgi:hypothetical protein